MTNENESQTSIKDKIESPSGHLQDFYHPYRQPSDTNIEKSLPHGHADNSQPSSAPQQAAIPQPIANEAQPSQPLVVEGQHQRHRYDRLIGDSENDKSILEGQLKKQNDSSQTSDIEINETQKNPKRIKPLDESASRQVAFATDNSYESSSSSGTSSDSDNDHGKHGNKKKHKNKKELDQKSHTDVIRDTQHDSPIGKLKRAAGIRSNIDDPDMAAGYQVAFETGNSGAKQ